MPIPPESYKENLNSQTQAVEQKAVKQATRDKLNRLEKTLPHKTKSKEKINVPENPSEQWRQHELQNFHDFQDIIPEKIYNAIMMRFQSKDLEVRLEVKDVLKLADIYDETIRVNKPLTDDHRNSLEKMSGLSPSELLERHERPKLEASHIRNIDNMLDNEPEKPLDLETVNQHFFAIFDTIRDIDYEDNEGTHVYVGKKEQQYGVENASYQIAIRKSFKDESETHYILTYENGKYKVFFMDKEESHTSTELTNPQNIENQINRIRQRYQEGEDIIAKKEQEEAKKRQEAEQRKSDRALDYTFTDGDNNHDIQNA